MHRWKRRCISKSSDVASTEFPKGITRPLSTGAATPHPSLSSTSGRRAAGQRPFCVLGPAGAATAGVIEREQFIAWVGSRLLPRVWRREAEVRARSLLIASGDSAPAPDQPPVPVTNDIGPCGRRAWGARHR